MAFSKLSALAFAAIIFTGCSPLARLTKDFTKNKTSIEYMHTSRMMPSEKKLNIYVAPARVSDTQFPPLSVITKTKSQVIPLIVVTTWKHDYQCVVGQNQIVEDLPSFVRSSFIEEASRRGHFSTDSLADRNLTLEIDVDSLGARGPYQNSGHFIYLFFAYTYQVIEQAGPGSAYSRLHYKVKDGDKVVLEDYISNTATFGILRPAGTTQKQFHEFYRANLVESLSDTFRRNIEELVSHINFLVDSNAVKLTTD
jgi:hypothetical protein